MSFLAQVSYTGNGSTTQYSITFPYIDVTHVKAYLNGVLTSAYTISSSTLTFTTAPANGVVIRIERETPNDNRLVDFTDGSVLTEQDLDRSADQNFYIAQEITDDSSSKLGLDTDDKYDANNKVIKNLANPVNDTDAVNKQFISTNLPNITTVAGISGAVSTVAGISSAVTGVNSNNADITTVAGQITPTNNISTLAGINADITTVANNETDIQALADLEDGTTATGALSTLAGLDTELEAVYNIRTNITNVDGNSANVNLLAGQISPTNNISTLANLDTELSAIYNIRTNITNVDGNSANVNLVAGQISPTNNISTLAVINADITAVANNNPDVSTVAGQISPTNNISTLAGLDTEITGVYNIRTNVTNVDTNSPNVNLVAGQISPTNNIATLGALGSQLTNLGALGTEITNLNNIRTDITGVNNINSQVQTVAGLNTEITNLDSISADITAVSNIASDIQDVQDKIAELQTVANDLNEVTSEIDTVATYINQVDAVGTDLLGSNNIGTVASNLAGVNSFADRYRVGSSDPTTSLDAGDLAFNTTGSVLKYYDGSSWQGITAGGITDVVQDSTPQLGGNLDVVTHSLVSTSNRNIAITPNGSGKVVLDGLSYPTSDGTSGQAIVTDGSGNLSFSATSSAEVYGFNKDASGNLIVTTTNGGVDNITQSQYANFDDVLFSASGFTFSLSNGELIATI